MTVKIINQCQGFTQFMAEISLKTYKIQNNQLEQPFFLTV